MALQQAVGLSVPSPRSCGLYSSIPNVIIGIPRFRLSFIGLFCCPLPHLSVFPHLRAFLFIRQRYMGVVEMKEFRHSAFALKKITMLSAPAPTFFSFKTFLIPLSRTSISRKKKAQTQMGNDSLKKKSADKRPNQDKGFKKKV